MEKTKEGKVISSNGEQLEANSEKRKREINEVAKQLNAIKLPLSATVYSHGMQWTLRNVAFWESLKASDENFLKLINISPK